MDKKFKLQKVLEFREKKLDDEKTKLADMYSKKEDYKQKKVLLKNDINRTTDDLYKMKSEGKFEYLNMYENFILRLEKMLSTAEDMIDQIEKDIDNQQVVVTNALNDLKIMEKLKEKHIQNYMMYIKKEEMKLLEDIVISKYNGVNNA